MLIFQPDKAAIRQVWLENCADFTCDNFYFNIKLMYQWGIRKVKLITSPSPPTLSASDGTDSSERSRHLARAGYYYRE